MNLPRLIRKPKKFYVFAALILFVIEVLIERFAHDDFIRPYLGDFFVVILLYALLMSWSKLKIFTASIITLLLSYVIETAQYLQIISFLGLEDQKWARILIGTSFSWWDMLMYTLGILFVLIFEVWSSKPKIT